jgi:glycosyltransferase involved in cell wall biosynthesis
MRILIANHRDILHPQAGGLEEIMHETAKRWVAAGHGVDVLCAGYAGASKEQVIDGVRYLRGPGEYVFHWWVPWKVRSLLPRRYDVILEYMSKVPSFLPLFVKSVPIAVMIPHLFGATIYEELPWPLAFAWCRLERLIPFLYRASRVWVNSQSTAADLRRRGIAADRIDVIYAGVPEALFAADSSVPKTPYPSLLYVGRLKQYKRVDLAIQAMRLLKIQFPGIRLRIAGQGSAEANLKATARELGLERDVEFQGYVSEEQKKRLLLESWVGVQTSSNEGWGLAVTEAGACGVPTVASDSPGLRESVHDGETGMLVPHGDVEMLATKLTQLLSDEALRMRMGAAARAFAKGFTWDRTAHNSLAFLERMRGSA